jgi:16S rRNA processing protein RimM
MSRLEVGYVARAHGVRGELRVHLHAPESETLLSVERVWLGDAEYVVEQARPVPGAVLLTVDGVADRDRAESLKGQAVSVRRDDVELAPGEYLLADLIGCAVVDGAGAALGTITSILHGAQDILVIHDATHERLLPLVPAIVLEVDTAAKRVVVDPPEDLPAEPLSRR